MTSTELVAKHRKRQEQAGLRRVSVYLPPQSIETLQELSRPTTRGEVIERALAAFINKDESGRLVEEGARLVGQSGANRE